ncbi:hypothetical protein KEM55_004036 [Ascosphaera atra]|nr:hypothetical protein KEM55_004036 [Ascosphaera atra]
MVAASTARAQRKDGCKQQKSTMKPFLTPISSYKEDAREALPYVSQAAPKLSSSYAAKANSPESFDICTKPLGALRQTVSAMPAPSPATATTSSRSSSRNVTLSATAGLRALGRTLRARCG